MPFEHTLLVNFLFACKCDCLDNFQQAIEMNVNISNEFNFSEVHGSELQWVASKAYMNPFGVHSLCTQPTVVHSSNEHQKNKIHFFNKEL